MNKEHIKELIESTKEDVDFASSMSNEIVDKNTKDLDELMNLIRDDVIGQVNADDEAIEYYLAELTNTVYFIGARCDNFGFYEDVSKANAKLKYNEKFSENQMNAVANAKKTTNAESQIYAENESVDEAMLNIIYSRSVKIINGKLDSAREMIRTLSKILSVHMNDRSMAKVNTDVV